MLTPRERTCMSWVAVGKTSREIAAMLEISARTVDYHVNNVCSKFAVNNRHSAVTMALQHKQIPDISHLLPPLKPSTKKHKNRKFVRPTDPTSDKPIIQK